jgi:hypothetical protein
MKSEFMREFDFQYEKTADVEFSTIYARGYSEQSGDAQYRDPGWARYCDEELDAEEALRAAGAFIPKMVA